MDVRMLKFPIWKTYKILFTRARKTKKKCQIYYPFTFSYIGLATLSFGALQEKKKKLKLRRSKRGRSVKYKKKKKKKVKICRTQYSLYAQTSVSLVCMHLSLLPLWCKLSGGATRGGVYMVKRSLLDHSCFDLFNFSESMARISPSATLLSIRSCQLKRFWVKFFLLTQPQQSASSSNRPQNSPSKSPRSRHSIQRWAVGPTQNVLGGDGPHIRQPFRSHVYGESRTPIPAQFQLFLTLLIKDKRGKEPRFLWCHMAWS